jgi:hypothetical protein
MSRRPVAAALAVAATSLAVTAAPALAKGGGGGSTPPPADPAPLLCPEYAATGWIVQPDGSTNFANEVPGVLCVVVHSSLSGTLTLAETRVGEGWSANVKSAGGGSQSRIDVEATNRTSGERREIIVQPGKTVVK